jgi:hypothetical protein
MSVDATPVDGTPVGSDTSPSAADVRAAADALKQAIDRHLQAVENRAGEQDEQVQDAYAALHAAAELYDDLLFEVHDEVTPFSFVAPPVAGPDADEINSISVVARRDYDIVDSEQLLSVGRSLFAADQEAAEVVDGVDDVSSAVAVLFDRYELEGFDARAEETGLLPAGATTWVLPGLPPRGDEEWVDAPFVAVADADVIYRIDVDPADADTEDRP